MRGTALLLLGLAAAAPVRGAETSPCKTNREAFLQEAAKRDCADEENEVRALTCTSTGAAHLRETKRLEELLLACRAKGPKGAGASAAPLPADVPAGRYKYRAVDATGVVIASAGSDRSGADAVAGAKDQIRTRLCNDGIDAVEFTLQFYRPDGTWTKGVSSKVRCGADGTAAAAVPGATAPTATPSTAPSASSAP